MVRPIHGDLFQGAIMSAQTLGHALELARHGVSAYLRAARRLNGLNDFGTLEMSDGGLLGQAMNALAGDLPAYRRYTLVEWIEATHERVTTCKDACDVWRTTLEPYGPPPVQIKVGSRVRARHAGLRTLGVGMVTRIVNGDHHVCWTATGEIGTGWHDYDLRSVVGS